MTRIGIVGAGRAATIHAETAAATRGVDLVGVGGRPGSGGELAGAMGVPDLALADLVDRADGLVLAVPAGAMEEIVAAVPDELPLLVESPVGAIDAARPLTMTAVNLLHSPVVKRALAAIRDLGTVHHLTMRGRAVRRHEGADILREPHAGAWPVLLAAGGTAVEAVRARHVDDSYQVELAVGGDRSVTAALRWATEHEPATTEIEAAGASGTVSFALWPAPWLEVDGRPAASVEDHPLAALGFADQMRRFAAVCAGRSDPWPPLSVGLGVQHLAEKAHESARHDGPWLTVTP